MNLVLFEVKGGRLTFTLGGSRSIQLSYEDWYIFKAFMP